MKDDGETPVRKDDLRKALEYLKTQDVLFMDPTTSVETWFPVISSAGWKLKDLRKVARHAIESGYLFHLSVWIAKVGRVSASGSRGRRA